MHYRKELAVRTVLAATQCCKGIRPCISAVRSGMRSCSTTAGTGELAMPILRQWHMHIVKGGGLAAELLH